jgi:hypothetical protein
MSPERDAIEEARAYIERNPYDIEGFGARSMREILDQHDEQVASLARQLIAAREALAAAETLLDPPDSNGWRVRPYTDRDNHNICIPLHDPTGHRVTTWEDFREATRVARAALDAE